jgi:hypothetical protein
MLRLSPGIHGSSQLALQTRRFMRPLPAGRPAASLVPNLTTVAAVLVLQSTRPCATSHRYVKRLASSCQQVSVKSCILKKRAAMEVT